jgi:protein SCO1/2
MRGERAWLVRYVKAPGRMLAEGDPIAAALFARYRDVPMPNLRLSDDEIRVVLPYLDRAGREAAAPC